MMLNNPYEVRDGHLDGYHLMVEKSGTMTHGFNIDETVEQICLPGRTISANVDGRPKRIYRKDMTTLAQIWMIFCLHNVIPNRGKKGTMGFLSLITSLCARQGVQVTATNPIKKPITKKYIQQNYKEDTVEPQGQQPPQEPQQQHQQQQHFTLEQKIN
ncbi:hypothetical protein Lal_00041523 [Lupinus albus]|nr:hypothetical protein Lal_00041523 [Lupinus albus]